MVHEPAIVFTNVVLIVVGTICGVLLLRARAHASRADVALAWGTGLLLSSASTICGALSHALALPDQHIVWRIGLCGVAGASSFFFRGATPIIFAPATGRWLTRIVDVAAIIYMLCALFVDPRFELLMLFYGPLMLTLLIGCLRHPRAPGCGHWIAAIVLSFIGGGIQAAEIAPSPHFDHNALFHCVQLVSGYLFYLGARSAAQSALPSA